MQSGRIYQNDCKLTKILQPLQQRHENTTFASFRILEMCIRIRIRIKVIGSKILRTLKVKWAIAALLSHTLLNRAPVTL